MRISYCRHLWVPPITLWWAFHDDISVRASLNPKDPFAADFSYSQVFDVDLSSSEAEENENRTVVANDDVSEDEAASMADVDVQQHLQVQSEFLYEDITNDDSSSSSSCLVATEAFMEGELESAMEAGPETALPWWLEPDFNVTDHWYDKDEEDEDDDDEDNDGGHSSMLSNASVRRKRRDEDEVLESGNRISTGVAVVGELRGGATFGAPALSNVLQSELSRKLLVTALVTLVFEGCIGHILEFLKICMQTAQNDATYWEVIRGITSEKGVTGLWDGFVPWGVGQAIFKGAVFGVAHAAATMYLTPLANDGKIPLALALTMAGGIGGGFQGYVLSPTLLLKTRKLILPAC